MTPPAESRATADREIAVSRIIEGPPGLVFMAFTEASQLGRWWGPDGFSLTTESFEFSVGGEWTFVMHGPDGTDYRNWVRFMEISPPERLVVHHGSMRDDPEAFISVFTFVEVAAGTEVTLNNVFPTKEQRDQAVEKYHAIEGAEQTLGGLAAYTSHLADSRDERSG